MAAGLCEKVGSPPLARALRSWAFLCVWLSSMLDVLFVCLIGSFFETESHHIIQAGLEHRISCFWLLGTENAGCTTTLRIAGGEVLN